MMMPRQIQSSSLPETILAGGGEIVMPNSYPGGEGFANKAASFGNIARSQTQNLGRDG